MSRLLRGLRSMAVFAVLLCYAIGIIAGGAVMQLAHKIAGRKPRKFLPEEEL
jgi:hypothetical protein